MASGAAAPMNVGAMLRSQKIVADKLLREPWSVGLDPEHRFKLFDYYLGFPIQKEEHAPVVGVGLSRHEGGNLWLQLLSTVAPESLDVHSMFRKLELSPVPFAVTQCGFPFACGRPAKGGASIGHQNGEVGTLGCLVENSLGERFILSCNHVIAALNTGKRCVDETWEPASSGKRIGLLDDFGSITFGGSAANVIDAALSRPDSASDAVAGIEKLGGISGILDPAPFEAKVRKNGMQTGVTEGAISIRDLAILVKFSNSQKALFEKQIGIIGLQEKKRFAEQGDSGSIIVDEDNRAVGLLFATSAGVDIAYANPISKVLSYFDVQLSPV
jgi:hypothetical protein